METNYRGKKNTEEQIIAYMEGTLSPKERIAFELALSSQPELAEQVACLREAEEALTYLVPDQPNANFTHQLMDRLSQYPIAEAISIRSGLWLIGGVLIVAGICTALISFGVFDSSLTIVDINAPGITEKYFKRGLPGIALHGKVLLNIFVILNLAAAFVVLDRTVLRPFFQRRMNANR